MKSAHKGSRARSLDTLFLSASDITHIVACKGLAACLAGMADYIRDDFLRWPDFEKSARTASHSPDGVIELMPVANAHSYSFKYVNGHPSNYRFGLPTVMAFGVLADVQTGLPQLVSELTLTTALRTAATSALAARVLARHGSRSMALIGNGAQSEFQALAFHHLLGIDSLRLFDVDAAATAKLMRNLGDLQDGGMKIAACSSIADAIEGADIVTTITADKTRATIVTPEMIVPGMHLNAVGGDCPGKTELHPGVLRTASVFVEYEAQTRKEGEIQQMPADFVVTELWQVLSGAANGRCDHDEVTIFDSVGFALEDYAALRFMRDAARELGVGQALDLIPALANPKDLFALLNPVPATHGTGVLAA
jgi:ornithine cyclodeaminase